MPTTCGRVKPFGSASVASARDPSRVTFPKNPRPGGISSSVVEIRPKIPRFRPNKPQKTTQFRSRIKRPPRPFPWHIFPQLTPSRPKTKTHPDLGGKIGGLYGDIFPKKPRIEDFRIRIESGRFTGVFREMNLAIGALYGLIFEVRDPIGTQNWAEFDWEYRVFPGKRQDRAFCFYCPV